MWHVVVVCCYFVAVEEEIMELDNGPAAAEIDEQSESGSSSTRGKNR